jgi:hypothetical protein
MMPGRRAVPILERLRFLLISDVGAITMTRNEWKGKCGTRESMERNNKSFVRSVVFAYFVFSLTLAAVSLGHDRILAAGAQSNQANKQPNIMTTPARRWDVTVIRRRSRRTWIGSLAKGRVSLALSLTRPFARRAVPGW